MLNELKVKYPIIGDVRGFGLFLGIELVRDPQSLEPADKEVDQIVNSMKEKGILISTDGPDHNVLKIKPPLVFNRENALFLTGTLDEILSWDKERLYT
jgi:4-aminobutyrate aminotransferase-like enzyme